MKSDWHRFRMTPFQKITVSGLTSCLVITGFITPTAQAPKGHHLIQDDVKEKKLSFDEDRKNRIELSRKKEASYKKHHERTDEPSAEPVYPVAVDDLFLSKTSGTSDSSQNLSSQSNSQSVKEAQHSSPQQTQQAPPKVKPDQPKPDRPKPDKPCLKPEDPDIEEPDKEDPDLGEDPDQGAEQPDEPGKENPDTPDDKDNNHPSDPHLTEQIPDELLPSSSFTESGDRHSPNL
ncbi:hypothetical protein GXN76_13245 [Kroppenstedtia pulmonis]|uniref:Uncharacterized protein n=1 Tax=Kroppenstedtia pulmonis TaxID=1380685 RepID=A0A7D3Y643_9BACL|nr:hypothetical protein [Kroppenstedtia pulmonis]QKG85345.1 hypothetical protein GXN76_13245 [Kroppenstedtia pulmonis]